MYLNIFITKNNIENISYITVKENLIDDTYYNTFYLIYYVKYDNSIILGGYEFIIKCFLWFLTFFFDIKITLLYYLPYNINNYIINNQIKGLSFEVIHSIDSWKFYRSSKQISFKYTENHILDEYLIEKQEYLTNNQILFFYKLLNTSKNIDMLNIDKSSESNKNKNVLLNIKNINRYNLWELSFMGEDTYNKLTDVINFI